MRWMVAALVMILMAQTGAWGQTRTIANAGGWTAFGGFSNDQTPVCGIDTVGSEGRHFLISYFDGNSHITVRAIKRSWNIPSGTAVNVAIIIDNFPAWTARATGERDYIRFTIGLESVTRFEREFRAGTTMRLIFPDGTEGAWNFSLIGTNAIMNAFSNCLGMMPGRASPTQPHSGSAARAPAPALPTQPFSQPAPRRPATGEGISVGGPGPQKLPE